MVRRWHHLVLRRINTSPLCFFLSTGCEALLYSLWLLAVADMRAVSVPPGGGVICGTPSERRPVRCVYQRIAVLSAVSGRGAL